MNIGNSQTYTATQAGIYLATVTGINGCLGRDTVQITISPPISVGISISASLNPACSGTTVIFTAIPLNPGSSPFYKWKVNANNAGINNAVFTYIPLAGDLVSCVLTSSELCTTNNPASSIPISMTINPLLPVSVSIAASSNPFCANSPVTFTATPVNGGTTPGYQWKVNAINAINANNSVFTYIPLNGDVVTCNLTSSVQCPQNSTGTSNAITMVVNLNLPAGITIAASANPFCPGTAVIFMATAVNGGSSPFYQWKVNAGIINAGINNAVFSYNPSPGDSVSCILNSNLNCVTNNPVASNTIVMLPSPVPVVTFNRCFDSTTTTNAQPFKLRGGLPLGGTYSGPGVNSATGIFTPSIAGQGTHIITYSYTNVSTCTSVATVRIFNFPFSIFICGSILTDIRDNKQYKTFSLPNGKCWMKENLDFGFGISDLIPQTDNCITEKYQPLPPGPLPQTGQGVFYQWDELMRYDTVSGSQGLCPPGWNVPTSADWDDLLSFYNGPGQAGGFLKDTLLVNGFNSFQKGIFYLNNTWSFMTGIYAGSMYWSSTLSGSSTPSGSRAIARGINQYNPSVSKYESSRGNAFSVRCLHD